MEGGKLVRVDRWDIMTMIEIFKPLNLDCNPHVVVSAASSGGPLLGDGKEEGGCGEEVYKIGKTKC